MRTLALITIFFSLLAGQALAGSAPSPTLNQSLVTEKIMPVGTEVDIKVLQISEQLNASLAVVCFPENPSKAGVPGTASIALKQWPATDLRVEDVLKYTTTQPGFLGLSVSPDYRKRNLEKIEGGYRVTLEQNKYRWQVEVSFPEID